MKEYIFETQPCHGTSTHGAVLKEPVTVAKTTDIVNQTLVVDCNMLGLDGKCSAPIYPNTRERCIVLFPQGSQRPSESSVRQEERDRKEVQIMNLLAQGLEQKKSQLNGE